MGIVNNRNKIWYMLIPLHSGQQRRVMDTVNNNNKVIYAIPLHSGQQRRVDGYS